MDNLEVSVKCTELDIVQKLIEEIEYLRYFYSEAYDCLGPASDDVVEIIKHNWVKQGNNVPEGY